MHGCAIVAQRAWCWRNPRTTLVNNSNTEGIYRLNESRGQRIVWLLEELKLDYDIKVYMRQKDKHSPPELKKVHPLGKSPAITIEAPNLGEPLVLAESGAIVEYIADHFGTHLIPKRYAEGSDGLVGGETKEWLRYRVSNVFIYVGLFATTISDWCRSSIWNTLCFLSSREIWKYLPVHAVDAQRIPYSTL